MLLKAKGEWVVKKLYGQKSTKFLYDLMHAMQDAKQCMLAGEQPECVKEYDIPADIPPNIAKKPASPKEQAIESTSQECCDELTLR